MKAALVTPCLPHLPFHPTCLLGYGTAILAERYDLSVIDLNAELYYRNNRKLAELLNVMDKTQIASDALHFYPFYSELETQIDGHYARIPWMDYPIVYVTPPAWFPMVPTEAVLRLSRAIRRASPDTRVFFFSNSLGSWTDAGELATNGIQTVHLNDLSVAGATPKPITYDLLPAPVYENGGRYLFDLLPFVLKHGCSWGQCRFCSLSKGWNSGYLERSPKTSARELEALVDRHNPEMLVCMDNSLDGHNLMEFCRHLEGFEKPWCAQSRAQLSEKKIDALWKAGCRLIYFGLESGSERTLKALNKGITSKEMSDFIRRLHSRGIVPFPSLMVGAPGERRADFEKTLRFLADHRRYLDVVNVYPFTASPASEFASQHKEPDGNTTMRLLQFIQTCQDLGLKVCVGEQSAEYVMFTRVAHSASRRRT